MPGRLILQRRLNNSDGWRSVVRFPPMESPRVQTAAEMLSKAGDVFWRVVQDDDRQQVLAVFDGRRWQAVGETMPPENAPPWWHSGLMAVAERLQSSTTETGFQDTIPVNVHRGNRQSWT